MGKLKQKVNAFRVKTQSEIKRLTPKAKKVVKGARKIRSNIDSYFEENERQIRTMRLRT